MKIPEPKQEEAIALAVASPGFIIADDTGFGKTLEGIEVAKRTREIALATATKAHWRGLVVCPEKSRRQWARMIADQDPDWADRIYIPERTVWGYEEVDGWVIIGYHELIKSNQFTRICDVLWDIVIADEAHRIKNRKAQMSEAIKRIPRARAVCLTATPIEKYPLDLWSILNFIRPDEFPSVWSYIKRWIHVEKDWMDHWIYGGAKDPVEFGTMISHYMIRRELDVPFENEVNDVEVDMEERQKKAYDRLKVEKDVLVKVEDQELLIPNALSLLTKLQQISTHPPLLGLGISSGKMKWVKEFVEDHSEDRILVFTRFRDAAFYIAALVEGDVIVGGAGDGSLFKSGERRVCVGTIDAMGESLDGFQTAKYAVFVDAHWSTIKMTQAMGRIFRRGVTENKVTYRLHSCEEDRLVLETLEKKWTEAQMVYFFVHGNKDLDLQTD